jgi:hypothetical protein
MLGYGSEDKNAVLELAYNYGVTEYEKGNAYGQVGWSPVLTRLTLPPGFELTPVSCRSP